MSWILAHFIGDFVLQSDWMARNKKSSSIICTIHVTVYILPFLLCDLSLIQLSLIYAQHWIQDRYKFISWYCRMMGIFQTELKQDVLPWGHFIIDQIFHFVWMYFVIYYFVI